MLDRTQRDSSLTAVRSIDSGSFATSAVLAINAGAILTGHMVPDKRGAGIISRRFATVWDDDAQTMAKARRRAATLARVKAPATFVGAATRSKP